MKILREFQFFQCPNVILDEFLRWKTIFCLCHKGNLQKQGSQSQGHLRQNSLGSKSQDEEIGECAYTDLALKQKHALKDTRKKQKQDRPHILLK